MNAPTTSRCPGCTVEDEDEPRGVSARKMLAALIVVLLAVVMIAGAFFWLGHRESAGTVRRNSSRLRPAL